MSESLYGQYISEGTYGRVYKISIDSKILAAKKVPLNPANNSQKLVEKEKQVHSKCNHPNIIKSFHFFKNKYNFFAVMEFADLGTLYDLIKINRKSAVLNEQFILNVIIQICLCLNFLKANKIIHRDLKPDNILFTSPGILKIADFGLSYHNSQSKEVQAMSIAGTVAYMAPQMILQQYRNYYEPYSFSVDVWSAGIIIYQLSHGYLPFLHRSPSILRKLILKGNIIISDSIPKSIKSILQLMLQKDPKKRITPQEILNMQVIKLAMRKFIEQQGKSYLEKWEQIKLLINNK